MDDERELLTCIAALAAEEHWHRDRRDRGLESSESLDARINEIERTLNQLWSELLERRAAAA
jgi:hypothetical protein